MVALLKQSNVKRFAIIDIGTNTFNLLIIDRQKESFNVVFKTKVGVGLGIGGINENKIHPSAMERGLNTLKNYKTICNNHQVDEIIALGTSALRNASNKIGFLKKVADKLSIKIQIISGQREAELIYKGVVKGLKTKSPFLIMDIGGGSTEFILADLHKIKIAESFEIGAARIFQLFDFSDPFTQSDCQKIEHYLENGIHSFFEKMKVNHLIGASGSFETFYELISNKPYPSSNYVELPVDLLLTELEKIIHSTKAEREKNKRIIAIRKTMAPIAAVKIRWIIRKLNINKITISPFSMKEGVLTELAI